MAPQEPEQGSWLPGSLRGLAPQEPEPGRLLPGVTIYHNYGMLLMCRRMLRCCRSPYAGSSGHFGVAYEASQN